MQEFPAASPAKLLSEDTGLESLVHHRETVDAGLPLEQVQQKFQARAVEFMAVERAGRVIGLCARGRLGFVMGSRFGFAIHSRQPIESLMVAKPLIIKLGMPVRTVLDVALARPGDEFHDDVVLVDPAGRLLGLIKVQMLAQLQSRLVAEQLAELRQQHEKLRLQTLELFSVNHAARQSQGLYLGLFASHTLGVALMDREGRIREHNRRLAELLNFRGGSPANVSLGAWVSEKERPEFLALLEAHARGGAASATDEFTLNVPERGARVFRCSIGWIGETGEICACFDDVTEQRALERNMLRHEKQTLLDTLVGGIAHELNNKLTPVQGYAELLGFEAGERGRCYVEPITKSVNEAARIVRQLLELSKPTLHVSELVDLCVVAEEAMVMLRFEIREARCEVRTHVPAEPLWVPADAGQIKQVVINLAMNALHAMEFCTVRVLTLEVRAAGANAELIIADTGCGIPAENLERIFDPFFTTKGPERGTGLGLSICFSLMRQHSGDISVESEPGVGTRFTVSLPQAQATALLPFTEDQNAVPPLHLDELPRDRRVLVVEDEVVLRRLMQEILGTRFGCRVDVAANGVEALALLDRGTYALVLSDIRMSKMNGTELYQWLTNARPELARRFVFITGHPGDQHLATQIAQWNVPVIAKPFTLARLVEACGPFLQTAPPVRPAGEPTASSSVKRPLSADERR